MLTLDHLCKSYGGIQVTRDVCLDFPQGSLSAVIGPNGAGKTTLFNLISGHVRAESGRIEFDGADISGLSSLAIVRRGMARAFQIASLFLSFTVRDALAAAVTSHQRGSWQILSGFPAGRSRARVEALLELMGLEDVAGRPCSALSHGDQKLLDIGLALAMQPKMLLLDEPTAGMGPEERWRMIERVHSLWQREGLTVLFIEHDMDIVFKIAQRIHVLKYGAVLASGTAEEIRRHSDVIEAYLGTDHHLAQMAGEA